jgi:SpoVK/Ycf46/Vps4 family AAA+-type ATPase
MVLLEDLDRAFPKTGETKSRISLQALLNCLDGVGTGEGIVVVATANEPTILDPAILRGPVDLTESSTSLTRVPSCDNNICSNSIQVFHPAT